MCEKPSKQGTFGVLQQNTNVVKSSKYHSVGISPKGGFKSRVNRIDNTLWRVYRIDVSAFWGLASGRDRCFWILAGLCEQDGCKHKFKVLHDMNRLKAF